jgi:hypothetical protein
MNKMGTPLRLTNWQYDDHQIQVLVVKTNLDSSFARLNERTFD